MKTYCEWCDVVLLEVQNLDTDEDYVTPFICKSCCEGVFEEGTEVEISKAYDVIQAKSGNMSIR
jgi:hypothetical protein